MALGNYVYPVNVTTPPNTAIATPITTEPNFGDIWVDRIEVKIPPGHRGLTGIYIANSKGQLVPYSQVPFFLVGDNDDLSYDLGVEVDTLFQIVTYNIDVFPHTHYLRIAGQPMSLTNQVVAAPAIVPVA